MKELVIVSGKGGTGKTSISAALAFLAPQKVLVDCDVDAANFHLISGAIIKQTHEFKAGFEPHINEQVCTHCGKCTALCRFNAITAGNITTPLNCEGCGVCSFNCPEYAIPIAGQLPYSDAFRTAVQSGKTVMETDDEDVKEQMTTLWHNLAKKLDVPLFEEKIGFFSQRFNIFRHNLD